MTNKVQEGCGQQPPPAVLVTGATGFVGSRLARRLMDSGWPVHLLIRTGSLERLDESLRRDAASVQLHDGTTEGMIGVLTASRPEIVFHLASLFLSGHEPKDLEPLIRSNVLFGTQMAEAMCQCGVRKLVNTGTAWQHYEDEGYNPVNLYAATKEAYDCMLRYYAEACGLEVITLKLYDTYGPGDPRPKLIPTLLQRVKDGGSMQLSPGGQPLDIVHIDDVTRAYVKAADRLYSGAVQGLEEYAVSSGRSVTMRELIRLIEQSAGVPLSVQWGGRPYRSREVMKLWRSGSALPGWTPQIALEEGLSGLLGKG